MKTASRNKWIALGIGGFFLAVFWMATPDSPKPSYSKVAIAQSLRSSISRNEFPVSGEIQVDDTPTVGSFSYTLNSSLQDALEKQFGLYRPDYAAFVALDPKTGAILSLISYTKENRGLGNLALKASFPAASIFKIVTAAAAVDRKKASSETVIAFTGSDHTLYKQNLKPPKSQRWVRKMRLREAFARSVNTVFGKLGIYTVPKEDLSHYAERFQFNQSIPVDLPVEKSTFEILGEDPMSLAEVASGFNRNVLMSPLQGALMAGAISNGGVMMEPYLVESFSPTEVGVPYQAEPKVMAQVISPETARELRKMMQDTVKLGTSRKSFRGLLRKSVLVDVEMGGKTGSLTGVEPKGKYDWFVGYAKKGDKSISLAVLTIHEKNWTVKSSYLATKAVETFFAQDFQEARALRAPAKKRK